MGGYTGAALLIVGLTVLNGCFAAAEIALISARRASLKADADRGSRGARAALRLLEEPSRLLSAVQVGITLIGFTASAVGAVSLAEPVATWLEGLGSRWPGDGSRAVAIGLVTVAVAYLNIVVGELVPKRIGLLRAESVAKATAGPVTLLAAVAAPVTWLLVRSTDILGLAFGIKPGVGRPGVTEEEIKLLVTEQGTLLEEEKRMIHEVFELGSTVAREIMVPRVDVVMIEDTAMLDEALRVFDSSGFSRLPVFHDDPDKVSGVLLLKDIVGDAAAGRLAGRPVTSAMRPPIFVPETKRIHELLAEMQSSRVHLVVVVDEYGGTAGVITMEDIVEEVVGEIADEFDPDNRNVVQTDAGWVVDARIPVEDANRTLGIGVEESDEYETLAGWLLAKLGHIPAPGETVVDGGFEFRVQAVRRRRIARVLVSRHAEQTGGDQADQEHA